MNPIWLLITRWNRAAGAVTAQQRHLDDFIDDSLRSHGSVAVNEDRRDLTLVSARGIVDLGTHDTLDNRINRFEMGRIRCDT